MVHDSKNRDQSLITRMHGNLPSGSNKPVPFKPGESRPNRTTGSSPYIPGHDSLSGSTAGPPQRNASREVSTHIFYNSKDSNKNASSSYSRVEGQGSDSRASGLSTKGTAGRSGNQNKNQEFRGQNGRQLTTSKLSSTTAQHRDANNGKAKFPGTGNSAQIQHRVPTRDPLSGSRSSGSNSKLGGSGSQNPINIEDTSDEEDQNEEEQQIPTVHQDDLRQKFGNGGGKGKGKETGDYSSRSKTLDSNALGESKDESKDELDFLPLPKEKKMTGMKGKNSKADVDIEAGRGKSAKKAKEISYAPDISILGAGNKSFAKSRGSAPSTRLTESSLNAKKEKTFSATVTAFQIGSDYYNNPEVAFVLVSTGEDLKLLRAPQAGNDQVIHFAVRLTDIGNVEAGRRNGQGLLKFALLTDDSQSAKSVRSVFKDWSASSSSDSSSEILIWVSTNNKESTDTPDGGLSVDSWKLLISRAQGASDQKHSNSAFIDDNGMKALLELHESCKAGMNMFPPNAGSNTTERTRKSTAGGVGKQPRLSFQVDASKKKNQPRSTSNPEVPTSKSGRPKPRPTAAARKSEGAKNQKTSNSYTNTLDDPHIIDDSDEEEPKTQVASTSKVTTYSKLKPGLASGTRSAKKVPQGLPPEDRKVTRYPPTGLGAVTISEADMSKLDEGEFLNDTIIEFGLKYLHDQIRARDKALAEKICIFSSFFHKRLQEGRKEKKGYEYVQKWTNKTDIFTKKYIIIPINEHLHWYLAIIVNPAYILTPIKADPTNAEPIQPRTSGRLSSKKEGDDSVDTSPTELKVKGKGKEKASDGVQDFEMQDGELETGQKNVPVEVALDNEESEEDRQDDGELSIRASPAFNSGEQERGGIVQEVEERVQDLDMNEPGQDEEEQDELAEEHPHQASASHPPFQADRVGPEEQEGDGQSDSDAEMKSGEASPQEGQSPAQETSSKGTIIQDLFSATNIFSESPSHQKRASEAPATSPVTATTSNVLKSKDTSKSKARKSSLGPSTVGVNGISVPHNCDISHTSKISKPQPKRNSKSNTATIDLTEDDMEVPGDEKEAIRIQGGNPGNGPLLGGGGAGGGEGSAREVSVSPSVSTPPPRDSQGHPEVSNEAPRPRSQSVSTDPAASQQLTQVQQVEQMEGIVEEGAQSNGAETSVGTSNEVNQDDRREDSPPLASISGSKKNNKNGAFASGSGSQASKPAKAKKPTPAQLAEENHQPILMVLDSLGQPHRALKKALEYWLLEEAKYRMKKTQEELGTLVLNEAKVPQQPNFCDCGVYLIHYFERLFAKPETLFPVCYSQDNSEREHADWLHEDVPQKREFWRGTILKTGDVWRETVAELKKAEDSAKAARRATADAANQAQPQPQVQGVGKMDLDQEDKSPESQQEEAEVENDLPSTSKSGGKGKGKGGDQEIIEEDGVEQQISTDTGGKGKGKEGEAPNRKGRARGSDDETEESEKKKMKKADTTD